MFPPSNCYLSFTPSLYFPPSLREFLHTCLNRDLDRCEAKDKRERKQIKISSLGTDTPPGPSLSRLRGFFFNSPHSPLGCFGACGYFRLSALQWFGMDAIMLQEKLVERLLCPRVRTARQKVKPGEILGTKHREGLRREESGSRGYCWWLLLGFRWDGLTPLRVFILFDS